MRFTSYYYPNRHIRNNPLHSQLPGKYTRDAAGQAHHLSSHNYIHCLRVGYPDYTAGWTIGATETNFTVKICPVAGVEPMPFLTPDLQSAALTTRPS